MKSKKTQDFPSVARIEVEAKFPPPVPKDAAIFFRLPKHDKEAIDAAADAVGLSTADYLLRCHEVISSKLGK